jgi:tripartite-type tricarboxylate transporter receptor subunit TctC
MKTTFQLLFRLLSVATLGIFLGTGTDCALAQSYPNKPVRFIVPYPAGGGTDVVTRLITQQLAIRMGQPIIVENHGGAGGNIGGNLVVRRQRV